MPFIYPSYPLTPNYGHPLLRNIRGLWQFGWQGATPQERLKGISGTGVASARGASSGGAARIYNGSSTYDSFGDNFDQGTNDFTLFAHCKPYVATGELELISKGDLTNPDILEASYIFGVSLGVWRLRISDGTVAALTGPAPILNKDTVAIGVRVGGTLNMYIDGVKYTGAGRSGSVSNSSIFHLGRITIDAAAVEIWNGAIYSAAIWNRALSDGEALLLSLNPGLLFKQQEYWRYVSLAARSLIFNTRRSFNNSILVR